MSRTATAILVLLVATSWWDAHLYVLPWLEAAGDWPLIGSPEWVALDDQDLRKKAAVLDAARHWALRLQTCQEARNDASKDLAVSADWKAIANESRQKADWISARPWMRRAA